MKAILSIFLVLSAALLGACAEAPTYVDYVDLHTLELNIHSEDMGIWPDQSVLDDPNNPFAISGVGIETKWDIQSTGLPIPAFYAWATLLAGVEQTGEAQFYAAENLKAMFLSSRVRDDQLFIVRDMAVRAYQNVFDNFPDAITFSADGSFSFSLLPGAFDSMLELGAFPQGGWTRIVLDDGTVLIVQRD